MFDGIPVRTCPIRRRGHARSISIFVMECDRIKAMPSLWANTGIPPLEADRVTHSENGLEMFFDPDHMALDSLRVEQVYIDLRSGN